MLGSDEIDTMLTATLEDQRLSRSEKRALSAVFAEHATDARRQALFRKRAFFLAREALKDSRDQAIVTWLEEVTKALVAATQREQGPKLAEAHFSPGDSCRRRIIGLCGLARQRIDVCVFTITDNSLANALLEAHGRGVEVRVITDDDKAEDRGSDIYDLARAGIEVRLDHSEHHMHHKFALFDAAYVVTGSYNWTRSAAKVNEENIVVSDDPRLVSAFGETYEQLWDAFGQAAREVAGE
ncbi:MAG: endonuclease [Proteobacteria bacterium]|nr:MAG: endonuclease [Pseudomonadota bacterium]PIE19089.1 MAG: endonuclease [Pseudomonadota bacterium]